MCVALLWPMTKRMYDLSLDEISGVDHPANLVEGWLVEKASPDPITASLMAALTTEGPTPVSDLTPTLTHPKPDEVADPVIDDAVSDEVAKALAGVTKELADAREDRDAARKERDALTATAELEKAETQVQTWDHVPELDGEFAAVLNSFDETQTAAVVKILDAAEIVLAKTAGTVLKEVGGDTDGDANDIEALAKAKVADGTYPNFHIAIAAVAEDNPALYVASKET